MLCTRLPWDGSHCKIYFIIVFGEFDQVYKVYKFCGSQQLGLEDRAACFEVCSAACPALMAVENVRSDSL